MLKNQPTTVFQRYKKGLMLSGAIAILLALAFYFSMYIRTYDSTLPMNAVAIAYLGIAVIFSAALVACYFLISRKDIAIEKIFLFFMLTAGVMYAVIFLPFTIPDEGEHYLSVYRLSNYFTFSKGQFGESQLLIRDVDRELVTQLRQNKLSAGYFASLASGFDMFADSNATSLMSAKFIESAPHGYIASALGIAFGRILRLGAIPTFYFGRFANLVVYTLAVYWSMKRIPYGKTALFVISASPMFIHLVASYSYDFIIVALAIMFVAQIIYMREKEGKVTVKDLIICAVISLLLAPAKMVYFPILLMIFLVPNEKFTFSRRTTLIMKSGVVAIGIALLLATQLGKITTYMGDGNTIFWSEDVVYSISRAFTKPIEFIRILLNTVYRNTDYYASMMVANHMDGTGGVTVPAFLWVPMLAVTFYSFLRKRGDEKGVLPDWPRFFLFVIVAAVCAMSVLSILFSFTPISSTVVEGVQGRYFIPVLPVLILAMRGRRVLRSANSDKYIIMFCIYYNLLMPLVYIGTLFR